MDIYHYDQPNLFRKLYEGSLRSASIILCICGVMCIYLLYLIIFCPRDEFSHFYFFMLIVLLGIGLILFELRKSNDLPLVQPLTPP